MSRNNKRLLKIFCVVGLCNIISFSNIATDQQKVAVDTNNVAQSVKLTSKLNIDADKICNLLLDKDAFIINNGINPVITDGMSIINVESLKVPYDINRYKVLYSNIYRYFLSKGIDIKESTSLSTIFLENLISSNRLIEFISKDEFDRNMICTCMSYNGYGKNDIDKYIVIYDLIKKRNKSMGINASNLIMIKYLHFMMKNKWNYEKVDYLREYNAVISKCSDHIASIYMSLINNGFKLQDIESSFGLQRNYIQKKDLDFVYGDKYDINYAYDFIRREGYDEETAKKSLRTYENIRKYSSNATTLSLINWLSCDSGESGIDNFIKIFDNKLKEVGDFWYSKAYTEAMVWNFGPKDAKTYADLYYIRRCLHNNDIEARIFAFCLLRFKTANNIKLYFETFKSLLGKEPNINTCRIITNFFTDPNFNNGIKSGIIINKYKELITNGYTDERAIQYLLQIFMGRKDSEATTFALAYISADEECNHDEKEKSLYANAITLGYSKEMALKFVNLYRIIRVSNPVIEYCYAYVYFMMMNVKQEDLEFVSNVFCDRRKAGERTINSIIYALWYYYNALKKSEKDHELAKFYTDTYLSHLSKKFDKNRAMNESIEEVKKFIAASNYFKGQEPRELIFPDGCTIKVLNTVDPMSILCEKDIEDYAFNKGYEIFKNSENARLFSLYFGKHFNLKIAKSCVSHHLFMIDKYNFIDVDEIFKIVNRYAEILKREENEMYAEEYLHYYVEMHRLENVDELSKQYIDLLKSYIGKLGYIMAKQYARLKVLKYPENFIKEYIEAYRVASDKSRVNQEIRRIYAETCFRTNLNINTLIEFYSEMIAIGMNHEEAMNSARSFTKNINRRCSIKSCEIYSRWLSLYGNDNEKSRKFIEMMSNREKYRTTVDEIYYDYAHCFFTVNGWDELLAEDFSRIFKVKFDEGLDEVSSFLYAACMIKGMNEKEYSKYLSRAKKKLDAVNSCRLKYIYIELIMNDIEREDMSKYTSVYKELLKRYGDKIDPIYDFCISQRFSYNLVGKYVELYLSNSNCYDLNNKELIDRRITCKINGYDEKKTEKYLNEYKSCRENGIDKENSKIYAYCRVNKIDKSNRGRFVSKYKEISNKGRDEFFSNIYANKFAKSPESSEEEIMNYTLAYCSKLGEPEDVIEEFMDAFSKGNDGKQYLGIYKEKKEEYKSIYKAQGYVNCIKRGIQPELIDRYLEAYERLMRISGDKIRSDIYACYACETDDRYMLNTYADAYMEKYKETKNEYISRCYADGIALGMFKKSINTYCQLIDTKDKYVRSKQMPCIFKHYEIRNKDEDYIKKALEIIIRDMLDKDYDFRTMCEYADLVLKGFDKEYIDRYVQVYEERIKTLKEPIPFGNIGLRYLFDQQEIEYYYLPFIYRRYNILEMSDRSYVDRVLMIFNEAINEYNDIYAICEYIDCILSGKSIEVSRNNANEVQLRRDNVYLDYAFHGYITAIVIREDEDLARKYYQVYRSLISLGYEENDVEEIAINNLYCQPQVKRFKYDNSEE